MFSRDELARDFRSLDVAPGDTVMLHASVRAVEEIAGGPDQIHLALKDTLTSEGTLIMYASCPQYTDEVGRGHLTSEQEHEVLEKLPVFDPLTARSQRENGALVELLRTYPGSRVNGHVARFVVWGKHAEYLISEQPWNYAFGRGSLFERFLKVAGKILLLGSDHDNVTFLHYVEHVGEFPGKRVARYRVPVEENGMRVWREMEEFDSSGKGVHPNFPEGFFAQLVDGYLDERRNAGARVGIAASFIFPAQELMDFAMPRMISVATAESRAGDGDAGSHEQPVTLEGNQS